MIADRRTGRRNVNEAIGVRTYSSFLVRRWRVSPTQERVDVEHTQSGRRVSLGSLHEAARWMHDIDAVPWTEPGSDQPPVDDRSQSPETHSRNPVSTKPVEGGRVDTTMTLRPLRTDVDPDAVGPVAATLDVGAENCATLILHVRWAMAQLAPGDVIAVVAYDPSAQLDLRAWCGMTRHAYLGMRDAGDYATYYIRKRDDRHGEDTGLR